MRVTPQAVPVTPMPLSLLAPMTPATIEPWPWSSPASLEGGNSTKLQPCRSSMQPFWSSSISLSGTSSVLVQSCPFRSAWSRSTPVSSTATMIEGSPPSISQAAGALISS